MQFNKSVTLAIATLFFSCTWTATAAPLVVVEPEVNAVRHADVSIVLSPDAWVACTETVKKLAQSAEEAVESVEACTIGAQQDQKLVQFLFLGAQASALYVFTATMILRYTPAAFRQLTNVIASYSGSRPLYGEALKSFARDLVLLLRRNKFTCPSSSNPLTCRRPSGSGGGGSW